MGGVRFRIDFNGEVHLIAPKSPSRVPVEKDGDHKNITVVSAAHRRRGARDFSPLEPP